MSWKSIYEKACFMMADMDEGNAFPDKYELSHVVVNFDKDEVEALLMDIICLLYTSPSPRDATLSSKPC